MRPVRSDLKSDRAFTLTEALAGLVLACMLMAGLFELTGIGARAAMRAAENLEHARAHRLLGEGFDRLQRCRREDVAVSDRRIDAEIGASIRLVLGIAPQPGRSNVQFQLESPGGTMTASRTLKLEGTLGFRHGPAGMELWAFDTGEVIARTTCLREAAHDCRFDNVSRSCR
jgi:hypothetical protein